MRFAPAEHTMKFLKRCLIIKVSDILFIQTVLLDKNKKKNIFEHYIDEITNKKLFELLSNYDTMIEFFDFGTPKTEKSKLNLKSYDYYKIDKYYIETIENTRLGIDSTSKFESYRTYKCVFQ